MFCKPQAKEKMGEEKQKLKGRCQLQTQSQTLKAVISISNIEQCSSGLYKQHCSHFWFYSERLENGLARVKRGSDEWVKLSLGKVLGINPLGTVSSLVIFYLFPSSYFISSCFLFMCIELNGL